MKHSRITKKEIVYIALLLLLMFFLVMSVKKKMERYRSTENLYLKKLRDYHEIVQKEKELNEQNRYLVSDFGKERVLREKYNVTKQHEEAIALLPNKKESSAVSVKHKTWWDYFVEFTGW